MPGIELWKWKGSILIGHHWTFKERGKSVNCKKPGLPKDRRQGCRSQKSHHHWRRWKDSESGSHQHFDLGELGWHKKSLSDRPQPKTRKTKGKRNYQQPLHSAEQKRTMLSLPEHFPWWPRCSFAISLAFHLGMSLSNVVFWRNEEPGQTCLRNEQGWIKTHGDFCYHPRN